ncbi:MAG: hypothetical protein Q9174_006349 [Haloplaca sp. 1 TL-2023]
MVKTFDPEVVWDKPNDVDTKWIEFIDENVLAKLPEGSQPLGIQSCGESYFTRGAKISTKQPDGSSLFFFLKVALVKDMISAEFISQSTLYAAVPDFTPKPYGWGTYAADPSIHFFLCAFVDMEEVKLPDRQKFAKSLATLHTITSSPTGLYGFHVSSSQGKIPQFSDWTDTWEEFFSRTLQQLVENEEKAQGVDAEMQRLLHALFKKVIPRLLRPLETGGRSIRPCLVHGDIWDGNVATDKDTDHPVIFDSACLYAHNEYELAPLRPTRHRMQREYIDAYFEKVKKSEPEEDCDDRNVLYCLCIETMQYLVTKYADGYEVWAKAKGEEPATGYND